MSNFKRLFVVLSFCLTASTSFAQLTFEWEDKIAFSHGVSKQRTHIDLGDQSVWGWVEVTLTSAFSNENSTGKYTKRFAIGRNAGNPIHNQMDEVVTAFGDVADSWAVTKAQVGSDNHLRILIYHLTDKSNTLSVHIKGQVHRESLVDTSLFSLAPVYTNSGEVFPHRDMKTITESDLHVFGYNSSRFLRFVETKHQGAFINYDGTVNKLHLGVHNTNDYDSPNDYKSLTIVRSTGNVGIGTTDPGTYKLAVKGSIGAGSVKVTDVTGWADFVFSPTYRLRPLEEVESFIESNGHLPEIPSEEEVKANGVDIGDMDAKLLQKIEELTLYSIEQQKQLQQQQELILKLNKRLDAIEQN